LIAGLWLGVTLAASPGAVTALRTIAVKPGPTLTAAMFTQRWPTFDEVEKPHRRETLRRLVQITPDADPDKPRFLLRLGAAETARWRATGRVDGSWENAIAAYTAAAVFPSFERRDAALYWLTRLYLVRAPDPSER